MRPKPITPYQRLVEKVCRWRSEFHRCQAEKTLMVFFDKRSVQALKTWDLSWLYERTLAADQLGYDVVLSATERGLEVHYVERHKPLVLP